MQKILDVCFRDPNKINHLQILMVDYYEVPRKLGPNSISLIAFWCFFLVNPGKFVKDTSSIFPVFHGQTRHLAVDGQWNVETVFAFQVGDLGILG